ncbi:MAG: DnaJ domain-containing protein, partial [Chloroflexota bacterium]
MAANADAYRTLGLAPGASLDEVKRAYRRLAKANHPDAAGEAALPRFLAIQAAYDRIVDPDGSMTGTAGPPAQPWEADTDRARATHRAYGGRARRTRSSRTSSNGRTGASGAGTTGTSGADAGGPSGAGSTAGASGPAGEAPPRSGRPPRPPKKATLGSTSYDGVEAEPFEPDWGGASWYGTTSGTYWTLNPKEYADPRKHGP